MEELQLPKLQPDVHNVFKKIFDRAQGTIITLSVAPTTANGIIKEDQIGIYDTKLYLTKNGTTYSINLTEV